MTAGRSRATARRGGRAGPSSDRQRAPSSEPKRTRATKRPRSRFVRVLLMITAVIHIPVALGVYELAMRLALPAPWLIAIAFGIIGLASFVGRARGGMGEGRRSPLLARFVDIPYFIHWCACVWTLIPAAIATVVAPFIALARGAHFALPLGFYMWTYAAGLVVCGYGVLVRRRWFRVQHVEVALQGLDAQFDGYKIAHLSDLHIGNTTPESWGAKWARASNAQAPDLAVVTGDMVTSGTAFHEDIARVVGALRAKDGVFVSMGNHDYFGEGEPLVSLLGARGARVLRNEGVVLARGDAKLYLAGIDDTWTKRDDIARALRDRPNGAPVVLLAHDPGRFPHAAEHGVDLTLSGHTHGGQIAVPFFFRRLSLSHLAHKFHIGIYKLGRSTLYVHPGLGTTGPPMRLGIAPAVVMITLRAA